MSLKAKALTVGLIAALAVSVMSVMNASATEGGHFVSTGNSHVEVKGFVNPAPAAHTLHLISHGLSGEIGCDNQAYTATTTTETTTSVTVTPVYANCHTTPGDFFPVTVNGCTYTFTVALNTTDNTEQTAHLLCPTGKMIEVHHPNCTMLIHPQTINGGLTYTTKGIGDGHEVTVDVNIQIATTRHGLCQFIAPTNGTATLIGSGTGIAFNTTGEQVAFTAT